MAVFGLQVDFMNSLLNQYFGFTEPNSIEKEIYIGLGLTQLGASINIESFDEVFSGRPLGNYKRARCIFGRAENEVIKNIEEVVFTTASEDWTDGTHKIEMLGIFDTLDYENEETGELIKPLIVLSLPRSETVLKGETIVLAPEAIQLSLSDI